MERLGGILITGFGFAQSHYYHKTEQNTTHRISMNEIIRANDETNIELETECVQGKKESERDMFDQRNQQLQTIILSSSIIFTATLTVVIQANLPNGTSPITYYFMAISGGFSFTFIFTSISICVELLHRTSEFMLRVAKKHSIVFNKAQNELEQLTADLENQLESFDQEQTEPIINGVGKYIPTWLRVTQENKTQIREKIVRDNLKQQHIVKHKMLTKTQDSFDLFWRNECSYPKMWAVTMFYASTVCTLISCGIFIQAQYSITYNSPIAGALFITCMSMSSFVFIIIIKNRLNTYNDESKDISEENQTTECIIPDEPIMETEDTINMVDIV